MKRAQEYFRFEMTNSRHSATITDDLLKSMLRLTPLPDDERYRLRVAISEIVSNSYLHGNLSRPDRRIITTFNLYADRIEIAVEDEGDGFEVLQAEEKYKTEGIYAPGGRGLKIVNKYADNVLYGKTEDGNFVVVVVKRYPLIRKRQPQVVE